MFSQLAGGVQKHNSILDLSFWIKKDSHPVLYPARVQKREFIKKARNICLWFLLVFLPNEDLQSNYLQKWQRGSRNGSRSQAEAEEMSAIRLTHSRNPLVHSQIVHQKEKVKEIEILFSVTRGWSVYLSSHTVVFFLQNLPLAWYWRPQLLNIVIAFCIR